jgi:hypothetical protein
VSCDITSCSPLENKTLFRRVCRLHLHDRKRKRRNKPAWNRLYPRIQNFIMTAVRTSNPTSVSSAILELETPMFGRFRILYFLTCAFAGIRNTSTRNSRYKGQGKGMSVLPVATWAALGPTQPPLHCVPGTLSLEVKRPGRGVDHWLPTSIKIQNGGISPHHYTSSWHVV